MEDFQALSQLWGTKELMESSRSGKLWVPTVATEHLHNLATLCAVSPPFYCQPLANLLFIIPSLPHIAGTIWIGPPEHWYWGRIFTPTHILTVG